MPFLQKNQKSISIFLCCLFAIVFYKNLFHEINKIEFWPDEIISINNARHPEYLFHRQEMEKKLGIPAANAEPPLHDWILFYWTSLVNNVAEKENYEFVYRIPFMIFHSVSSILFAVLVIITLKQKNNYQMFSALFFLTFIFHFLNPILFRYSLEVRPYTFAELSSVCMLLLYFQKKLHHFIYLPILILFLLNSFSAIIYIIPLYIFYTIENKIFVKNIFVLFFFYIGVAIALLRFVWIGNPGSFGGVVEGLHQMLIKQFDYLQIINAVCLMIISFYFYRKYTLFIFVSTILSISILFLSLYFTKNTFYPRYVNFLMPSVLLLIIMPLNHQNNWVRYVSTSLLTVFFILPWYLNISLQFERTMQYYRYSIGAKQIAVIAKSNKNNIIILNSNESETKYDFLVNNTFDWYMKEYGIFYERPDDIIIACRRFEKDKNALYVSVMNNKLCDFSYVNVSNIYDSIIMSHRRDKFN